MNQYIISGLSPVPYRDINIPANPNLGFKSLRAQANSNFTATYSTALDGSVSEVTLMSMANGLKIICTINSLLSSGLINPDYQDYVNTMQPFENQTILPGEVRFYTHDFADASTWSGKTCGDPVAPYIGGVTLHPLTGTWLNATGASMLQAYSTPGNANYQNLSYLYGSLNYVISPQYDDINFRWVDNLQNSWLNNSTSYPYKTYCYLDLSSTYPDSTNTNGLPAVWRDPSISNGSNIICKFDSTQGPTQYTNAGTTKPRGSWMCQPQVVLFAACSGTTLTGGAVGVAATGNITFSGTPTTGNLISTIIGPTTYSYTVLSTDTLSTIATAIVALLVNDVNVSASASAGVISLTDKTTGIAGNSLALSCSIFTGTSVASDATSSRWRIDPYSNSKILLHAVGMSAELTAQLQPGIYFRWKPYGEPSPSQQLQLEGLGISSKIAIMPEEGAEFIYHTIADFRFGCNEYSQSNQPESGSKSVTANMVYDYTKTTIPILDGVQFQRLDITLDNNQPVNYSNMARGTFIALQYPSF